MRRGMMTVFVTVYPTLPVPLIADFPPFSYAYSAVEFATFSCPSIAKVFGATYTSHYGGSFVSRFVEL